MFFFIRLVLGWVLTLGGCVQAFHSWTQKDIIFGKRCGQKIPKNISQTFSSALHSYMEDKNVLESCPFKIFSFNCSLLHAEFNQKFKFSAKENLNIQT